MRERGERKKQDILKAASTLFFAKGYDATTLEDIGRAVDLQPPSVYRYFKSKDEILKSVVLPAAEAGTAMIEGVERSAKSPTEKLQEAFHVHLRLFDDYYPEMFVVTAADLGLVDEELASTLKALKLRYTQSWYLIIESYLGENPALSGLNPEIVCFAALGMCNWMFRWYKKNGRLSSSEIADQYFAIFAQNL